MALKGAACINAGNTLGCNCGWVGRRRAGMATITDPVSVGLYTKVYKAIDNTAPSTSEIGCQAGGFQVPVGWRIASTWGTFDPRQVASMYDWGTNCLVVSDGRNGFASWGSKNNNPKQPCFAGQPGSSIAVTNLKTRQTSVLQCNSRVLLEKSDLGFKCLPM
jgi:hypothetical protein